MGYTTEFDGHLTLSKNLTEEQKEYINNFSGTRRMARNISVLMEMYDGKFGHPTPENDTADAIYGNEGEYFVKQDGDFGQTGDNSILDYNRPPNQPRIDLKSFNRKWEERTRRVKEGVCQPGLWCQWIIEHRGNKQYLVWDGNEKFYNYVEWLKYMIFHFFNRWGVLLNGEIRWRGEEFSDMGIIKVENNEVSINYFV